MVQPGPAGPHQGRGLEPRGARPFRGLVALARQAAEDPGAPDAAEHRVGQSPEHRGALRPRQRLLPALPRRDHDVFERGLRGPGPVARRCPAPQVRGHRRAGRAGRRRPRPGDREWLGWLRALRGRRARLPGDDHHDLAGAARPGDRADPRGGPRRSGFRRAARLPGHRGHVRRHRLDRDVRSGRRRVLPRLLRGLRPRAQAGRPAQHADDRVPGCGLRAAASGRELDPDLHLPRRRAAVTGRHRAFAPSHVAARPTGRGHRALLCAHAPGVAELVLRQPRRGPGDGLRRAVHPDVGLLPLDQRSGVRDRADPGPPDRLREAPRASPERIADDARRRDVRPRDAASSGA